MSDINIISAEIVKIQATIDHFEARKNSTTDQMFIDHLKAQKHQLQINLSNLID